VPWISELTSEKGIKDYWICMYSDFERGIKDYPEFVKLNGSMKAQTHSFFFFSETNLCIQLGVRFTASLNWCLRLLFDTCIFPDETTFFLRYMECARPS
jgi:hypothetical protein